MTRVLLAVIAFAGLSGCVGSRHLRAWSPERASAATDPASCPSTYLPDCECPDNPGNGCPGKRVNSCRERGIDALRAGNWHDALPTGGGGGDELFLVLRSDPCRRGDGSPTGGILLRVLGKSIVDSLDLGGEIPDARVERLHPRQGEPPWASLNLYPPESLVGRDGKIPPPVPLTTRVALYDRRAAVWFRACLDSVTRRFQECPR